MTTTALNKLHEHTCGLLYKGLDLSTPRHWRSNIS